MSFENFYEESDKADRRWWLFLGLAFLLLVIYFFSAYSLFSPLFSTYSADKQNETPTEFERLRDVDQLCTNLPNPEKFYFVVREVVPIHDGATAVIYRYQSNRDLDEIMPTFLVWFGSNDWKYEKNCETGFKKGNQRISIRNVGFPDANYEIYCQEEKISFGIYD
jgi:hypothetical protein